MKKILCLLCVLLMLTVCLSACKKNKGNDPEPTSPADVITEPQGSEPASDPSTSAPSSDYTITYELNGGENDPSNKTTYTGRSTVYLNDATRTGYTFLGWYDNPDFSGDRLYSIAKGTNRDITLYAKWQEVIVNVTYHLGADDAINSTANATSFSYHESAVVTLAEPVRSGYIFRGWYTAETMTEATRVQTLSRASLEAVDLWAKWEKAPDRWVTTPPVVLPNHDETVPAGRKLIIDMSDGPTGGTGFATYYAGDRTPVFAEKANGDPVLHWADLLTKSQMRIFNSAHKDLSAYNGVEFWMYNANAHGGSFVFLLGTDNRAKVHLITLDWTGWKKIYIDFASPSMQTWTWQKNDLVYSTSQIDAFICLSTGWGANISDGEAYPYSYVYIDDIYAVGNGSIYQPDPASFTSSDFEAVKTRWVELLVGTAALNGTDINVSNYADSMNTAANRTYLWSDKKTLTTEVGVYDNYARVYDMARAWAMPGSTQYYDAALLAKIVSALTFLNEYDADGDGTPGCYGQNVSVSRPGNWWHWQIGTPEYLVNTLMLIEDAVDASFIARMLEPVDICSPVPAMTMANRTWIAWPAIGSALLAGSGERVVTDIQALITVFDHVTTGDGFYDDGSFIQHNKLSYINGYGTSYFGSISDEIYIFAGTAFDVDVGGQTLSAYCTAQVMDELFNSWEPFIYRGTTMWTTSGRGMGVSSGAGTLGSVVQIIPYASTADAERFWSMVKYFETDAGTFSSISGNVKTVAKSVYNAYAARTDVEPRSGYYFAHVYAAMDRVTARTESYTALLAMSSTRIYRFEAINNAGSSGWYLGDGVLLLHGGNASDYQSARYSSMDKLRIPGTTVSSYKRENVGYTTDTGLLNRNAFVGGAYSDDYAAAAMFLAYSTAYKMGNFVSDLVAQKAYF
ncbi:MAG: InlB B-repeat-containing protein, partial [Clostridia bacterium]|nr:InlB B-repeat-containing protein [Clostridia bacterium]